MSKAFAPAGDIVVYVPAQNVMFTGDFVEYRSACSCGDGQYLPFDTVRAFGEVLDIDTPRMWTAARDKAVWEELQG
jgi:glyoxylase-like metal-dependent hydrolase (beta-lactamase superfamily II)